MAIKYWRAHINNVTTIIPLVLLAAFTPKILESYLYFKTKHTVTFEDNDHDKAVEVLSYINESPEQVIDNINNNLDNLKINEAEKDKFRELFASVRQELDEKAQPTDNILK